jgi:pimeloyl-ACP methyl ester carboxylesterase
MFSETRYAMNGDLGVAYRASRAGTCDIVFVPAWVTNCEVLPELPPFQGWVEAMTSLGRLIFFDQPGTGASDPVTPGALPTLEQWADSITAVLDDLGSREAVLVAPGGGFAPAALFAATHPSRTTALVVLDGYADAGGTSLVRDESQAGWVGMWGSGKIHHVTNPDMPWNEEIRSSLSRHERLAASPRAWAAGHAPEANETISCACARGATPRIRRLPGQPAIRVFIADTPARTQRGGRAFANVCANDRSGPAHLPPRQTAHRSPTNPACRHHWRAA